MESEAFESYTVSGLTNVTYLSSNHSTYIDLHRTMVSITYAMSIIRPCVLFLLATTFSTLSLIALSRYVKCLYSYTYLVVQDY